MKSALFVDFDNVYSGLRQLDPAYADRFARRPAQWMEWLIGTLSLPDHAPVGARRRVLVRRCYLNPQAYQRFRPSFNLAGFEIVDCPALTSEGKTSTDIHMVLDIVDLLQHEAGYDEFIVFSADADFTPVLRKLRRWDRRTTVLAIGFPSAAYRSSADLLIDQDDFVHNALGFDADAEAPPLREPGADAVLTDAAFKLMHQVVAEAQGPVAVSRLASMVQSSVDGIDASSWAGYGSFRALLESGGLPPLQVSWEGGGFVHDPKRQATPAPLGRNGGGNPDGLAKAVADFVKLEVGAAKHPIQCSTLADLIIQKHPQLAADWNGRGTFRKFAESLDVRPVIFDWSTSGGKAYDGAGASAMPQQHEQWGEAQHLHSAARQIHEVTGVPLLSPERYRMLLASVQADVLAHPFHLLETTKRVRDRCKAAGTPISRSDINQVLRGLLYCGHSFEDGPNDAASLAMKFADSVKSLCVREQMVLDRGMVTTIEVWLGFNTLSQERA
ncbi:NYN domain-containing protein [Cupriavidus sp. IK-TO18]|uniref:NYN domain-containing protein n=1 Tax=Cupriavidus sp. IK-TO18 TaxID=2782182 RepID=UPI00189733ED|nr:NYN domain-containing protein [Cupriavidus sp. IK-TO18]MBF6989469.1 NYN domain-containing protein [Cupriavidus sp. IK-TO18]